MELKKYKLGEIVKLHTITISPNSGTIYKLYSLPSFDNGMQCEIVDGNYIQSNKVMYPLQYNIMLRYYGKIFL